MYTIDWIWDTKYWAVCKEHRLAYICYRFGPLFIRKYYR